MAKKQLKKLNQPKKYLQGGSNLGSVSMMRQNPYFIGQVNQDAAEEDLANMQEQVMQNKQTAAQAKKEAEDMQNQQLDQTIRNNTSNIIKGVATDQKAGRLGSLFTRGPLSGQAAMNISAGTQIAPMYAAPATTTVASNVGSLAPGAVEVGANLANTSTNVVSGVNAATAGVPAAVAPTGELVTQGVATGAKGAAGLSSLATAGIGAAAMIGGKVIQKRADDNSAYTATDKEMRGNLGGGALAGAGTGFSTGAMIGSIVPGIGNVVGGAIGAGIGAGIGALKARKENKAAKEEAQRLQREQAAMRGAFQGAFVNSRLTSADPGNAYAANNIQNQFTNQYQVAQTGGVKKVPGGKIVPIEGTDAVEYIGRSHEEGGIFPEAKKEGGKINKGNIEVEGGETEDQVIMNDNSKKDYIFSKYLKLGGKSFAQRHKEILKGSGSQAEIQRLAAMQEEKAGRNPQQIAAYGGIHKYVDGGVTEPCQNGYVKDANGNCVPQQPYQQEGTFNRENPGEPTKWEMDNATMQEESVSGYRRRYYILPDGSTYEPGGNMVNKINSVKAEGAETEASLFALPGAIMSGAASGLAGATRLGFNMVNDKALGTGNSSSMGALPAGNTQAVGNYGGNVFAAKPQTESFNVFGNYPAMIKQAAALSASGAQPQSQGSSDNYTGPTGKGEGQQYFNNVGQGQNQSQGQSQGQAGQYNTAANAERMGWGTDVEGYINSGYGFSPEIKSNARAMGWGNDIQGYINSEYGFGPKKDSAGKKSGAKPYDREAWRKQGVGMMTDEELTAEGLGPKDSIPKDAQYRKPAGTPPPPVSGIQVVTPANITGTFRDNGDGTFSYGSDEAGWETSMDKNVAKSKFQTNQLNAANAANQTATGSTGYMAPAGVAGSAPNAQAGPVSAVGQTIVNGNPPSNAPAGTQSNVSSQTVTGTGTPAAGAAGTTAGTGTATNNTNPTAPTINNQNTKFQYTATGKGNLDYSDRNTAGGIWSGDRYEKEWKPLVASTMDDATKADLVLNYLTNYTGTDAEDVKAKLKGKTREQQIATVKRLATDSKVGPFHNAVYNGIQGATPPPTTNTPPTTGPEKPEEGTTEETPTNVEKKKEPCGPGTYLSTDGTCQPVPAFKQGRGIDGSMLAGLGQLVPVGAALLNPYKIAPGIMGAASIKGPVMPRVNMNQERAANIQQNVAFKNAVVNQNAGPAGLVGLMMANTKSNQQGLAIDKQEKDQNKQLLAQEGALGMDASRSNVDNSMKTQMFNAELNKDERRYRREDILGALDNAAARIAGVFKDKKSYDAQERLARALDETHSYDRFSIYEQLAKQAKQKNSPYNGVPDAELRRMAAGISEQIYGQMNVVAESPTANAQPARTGGVRQYVSRLGELKSARATKAKL